MRVSGAPVVDVRGPLAGQRRRLLSLLTSLTDAQWAARTAAPQWLVKDIALHLLDVDLSWLAQDRITIRPGSFPCPLTTKSSSAGSPSVISAGSTAPGY